MVDPCVFRLMLNDAVVAMLVVHVVASQSGHEIDGVGGRKGTWVPMN